MSAKSLLFTSRRTTLSLTFHLLYSTLRRTHRRTPFFFSPSSSINPPVPKKIPFKITAHGRTWDDPYHWMSNTDDPDFITFLNQENSYAEAFMADTHGKQREVFVEMTGRLPARVSTPPEKWGPWLYYQYIPEGKEYPVLCRRIGTPEQDCKRSFLDYFKVGARKEEILLDWNEIAEKYGYVHVGTCRVSPDHNFLAYTLDTTGSEKFLLQVKDLRDGHVIPNIGANDVVSLAWADDSSTLLYTVSDANQRPYSVHCAKVRTADESVLFVESDSHFCVDITSTKDGKFITINSNSRTSSEVHVIDTSKPLAGFRTVHKRIPGVQYFLEHHYGFFYVLTNYPLHEVDHRLDGSYYLTRSKVENVDSAEWQNIILPSEGTSFQDMDIFKGHLVLSLDKKGCSAMCSIDLPLRNNYKCIMEIDELNPWFFPVCSDASQMSPGSNHDFMTSTYRVVLSSPVIPDAMIEYDMSNKTASVVHQEKVLGVNSKERSATSSFELKREELLDIPQDDEHVEKMEGLQILKDYSDRYFCEKKEVCSHDGVRIPLTIVYSKNDMQRGRSPGLLHAYGAYGEGLDKSWCPDRLTLLDRGWVIAFADVRGGGGDALWHQGGCGVNKVNSIYDFVSCGKYLVDEGYVQRDRLAAIGYSAGSLLVGAAINYHLDLFHAVILKVPFLDVCNTLMDASLPLTILDYEEFGNPQIQNHFVSIMKYSPYDNIARGSCYPAMLVTASFHDSRVGVWEAAKWVAKIRDTTCTSCSREVILKTDMNGGHFGDGGRSGQCAEKAYEYAFLMKVMGMV